MTVDPRLDPARVRALRSHFEAQFSTQFASLLDQFERDLASNKAEDNAFSHLPAPATHQARKEQKTPFRTKDVQAVVVGDEQPVPFEEDHGFAHVHVVECAQVQSDPVEPKEHHKFHGGYIRKSVDRSLRSEAEAQRNMLQGYTAAMGWRHTTEDDIGPTHWLSRVVSTTYFDIFCALMIIINTIVLGVTTHQAAVNLTDEQSTTADIINFAFSVWFVVELLVRWVAEGPLRFVWSSPNHRWNIFDCLVVGADLVDQAIQWIHEFVDDGSSRVTTNFTIMRMLRVMRIAKALRVVRLSNFCKELRMMVLSTLGSGMPLLWSMVGLASIMYIFGVYLMQVVTQHLIEDDATTSEADKSLLRDQFGSLQQTGYTLFMTISGGIGWKDVADLLIEIHWVNGMIFCFYVFFSSFVVLNIITGIFVDTAFNSVTSDRNEVIMEEMRAENSRVKRLKRIFDEADVEKKGHLRYGEIERLLLDPRTHALLSAMDLEVDEAHGMMALLDPNQDGEVSIEEFLVGCLRLRGGAKSVDLVTLLYENKKMKEKWDQFEIYVKAELTRIGNLEQQIARDVHTQPSDAY